ncbi:hypothetical protein ACFVUS_12435 [Nocardia sp. NPDC058058]|uniref:hypothetical protein n=1 Tax=Nocardia sp. NPDC058058 TaxID=3346317 RepID=UPI0036DED6CF
MGKQYRHSVLHIYYSTTHMDRYLDGYPPGNRHAPIDEHMQEWTTAGWELFSVTPIVASIGAGADTHAFLFIWQWPTGN